MENLKIKKITFENIELTINDSTFSDKTESKKIINMLGKIIGDNNIIAKAIVDISKDILLIKKTRDEQNEK